MPFTPGSQALPPNTWIGSCACQGQDADCAADNRNWEPYCFRCGRPASSFSEYGDFTGTEGSIAGDRAAYVREQEGTYNRHTNRFACDSCYIAIGMPSQGGGGWQAP